MTSDTAGRLEQCFTTVFPNLDRRRVRLAAAETVEGWDSVAHVTLLTLIAEEFGIDLPIEEFLEALSFPAILDRLLPLVSV